MNAREKEEYLREYEILKKKGKSFFPYAIMKDSVMMLIVAGVLIAMSIIMGAEQGPKADPTTTTYTPRPESSYTPPERAYTPPADTSSRSEPSRSPQSSRDQPER